MSRRVGLRHMQSAGGKKAVLEPSAWSYFNTVGAIFLADPAGSEGGAYFNTVGAIFLADPAGSEGGAYFNR